MRFDMVAAADEALGIGLAGKVPWDLPGDVAFFKRITTETRDPARQNAVVMGRKTWDTIPERYQPLPRRLNVVVSRRAPELSLPPGVLRAASVPDALTQLEGHGEVARVFVIGGGEIYQLGLALPGCERIYLTRVEGTYGCDAFFPDIPDGFERVHASDRQEENGIGYVFETWSRRAGS